MAINYDVIREGDVFFTRDNSPLGVLIRWFTNSEVQHCGQLIKPLGKKLFYKCEMGWDITKKQDLKFNPIGSGKNIVSVKRPLFVYDNEETRLKFRNRMIKWHEELSISYDEAELLSHIPFIGSKKDKNKKKMICSRLVYVNLTTDGSRIKCNRLDDAVTPEDLYSSAWLTEVEGWKV